MAITLGKDAATHSAPFGTGIISATYTQECETVDISNRANIGGSSGAPGHKVAKAGFTTKTWEIECHDPTGLITSLEAAGSGFSVMSVTENIGIDGAITFTVSAKEFS
ncbi:MAG: hypothetical protein EBR82_25175 [Caulobacteraceae bacterium]|nr:hypothetical protein [Caulobacteraceae bacterium]